MNVRPCAPNDVLVSVSASCGAMAKIVVGHPTRTGDITCWGIIMIPAGEDGKILEHFQDPDVTALGKPLSPDWGNALQYSGQQKYKVGVISHTASTISECFPPLLNELADALALLQGLSDRRCERSAYDDWSSLSTCERFSIEELSRGGGPPPSP